MPEAGGVLYWGQQDIWEREQLEREERRVSTPLGEIAYTLSVKRVKNLNLRIRADGSVALSVGRRVGKREADDFVRGRAEWIFSRLLELENLRRETLLPPKGTEALPVLEDSLERMYPLVAPLGVNKPRVKARFMTSRWGSCHWTQGIIVLNTALTALPRDLMDYVTLHELAHFLHPDHGAGFYAVMDRLLPDWREKRRELRGYALKKGED